MGVSPEKRFESGRTAAITLRLPALRVRTLVEKSIGSRLEDRLRFILRCPSLNRCLMRLFLARSLCGVCAWLGFWSSAMGANLVINGDFEGNGGMGQILLSPYITYLTQWSSPSASAFNFVFSADADNLGAPHLFSVTMGVPNVHLWGPQTPALNGGAVSNGFGASPTGGAFLGLSGDYQAAPMGQLIGTLVAGQQYTLSFDYAFAQATDDSLSDVLSLLVTFGGDVVPVPTVNRVGKGFSGWLGYSHNFTAANSSQILSFSASSLPTRVGFALIDNVRLELNSPPAVPEPGSLLLAAIGTSVAVVSHRRRRNRLS